VELSEDQQRALEVLLAWRREGASQHLTLGGYAGTGKTTLLSYFRRELAAAGRLKAAFCSYTGRAAQNLRARLAETGAALPGDTVSTIHGLIYTPQESSSGRISGWEKKDSLERDLIIVDEASMVDASIWRDLLSFGVPVLAVGDHGQLPPVAGRFNLMEKPDAALTRIHRQAEGNPIITVATHARTTGLIPCEKFGPGVAKYSRGDPDAGERSGELLESWKPDTLILCGYNNTRNRVNAHVRASLGYETPEPCAGDRVICLRNNRRKGIYNGMTGTALRLARRGEWYEAEIKMDERDKPYDGLIYAPQFGAKTGVNFTEDRALALQGDLFDFGYALTVHKAQGGQARRVVLFEERFAKSDDEAWRRWLYTGVTRAVEELYIFG
jgi:exodeoxyribonuclease V